MRGSGNRDAALDREKFPRGMRACTDELRDLGLRPGLWWSPTARLDASLYREHPEWFLGTAQGGPWRVGDAGGFLGLSIPAAPDFVNRVLSVILGE